jgi:type IV secretion system protein VirD4
MSRRDLEQRPHVVGSPLADFGTPGLALVVVLLAGCMLGVIYLVGQMQAARSGADYVGPLLAHLADIGAAWDPALDSSRLWAIGGGVTVAGWWVLLTGVLMWRARRNRHREVRWARTRDLTDADLTVDGPQPGRLIVGQSGRKLVATPRSHSLIVFGPSGSGKTAGFAAPGLLEWDGPAVVSSVKTDLLRITRDERAKAGQTLVYDPLNRLDDVARVGWDPLAQCDTYEGAQALSSALVSLSDFGRVEKGDFWQSSAQSLLAPLLLAARRGSCSIREVRRWLNLAEWDTAREFLADDPEARESLIGATDKTPRDTALSYVATARVALGAYASPAAVESTTMLPQLDLDALLDGRQTLYLVGDEDDQKLLRPLFVGLIDAIMRRAALRTNRGQRAGRPLLVLLDEAANSAPLQDLDRYASVARDRGVQLVTIWQDLAQVEERFGADRARTIANNHQAKVILPGVTDRDLLEWVSRLLGEERILTRSGSNRVAGSGPNWSEQETFQPLITIDELRRMPPGKAVLLHGTTRPARIDLRPYYRSKQWRHLADRWQPAERASDAPTTPDVRSGSGAGDVPSRSERF